MKRNVYRTMCSSILVALFLGIGIALSIHPQVHAKPTSYPSAGTILVPGSQWAVGYASKGDLNVYSNGYAGNSNCSGGSGSYGCQWQCVELAQRWAAIGLGEPVNIWPNVSIASNMWGEGPKLPVPFQQHPNGGGGQPQFGDLLIFAGNPGHVAVVKDVQNGYVNIVEQNWSATGQASLPIINGWIPSRGGMPIIGWLRSVNSPPPPPPSVPSIVGMSGDDINVVTVTWLASSGGQGGIAYYRVVRNGVQIGTTPAGVLTFNDTSLPSGRILNYQIVGVDNGGRASSPSKSASVLLRAVGQSGLASVSVGSNLDYCRRTGITGPTFANQHLQCTVFDGTSWNTYDSGGGIDWGYDTQRAWLNVGGKPTYCRRTGMLGSDFANQHLQCTVFDGTSWNTYDSGGGIDWGYDVAAQWITVNNAAMYCRRTGMPGYVNQHLQCTAFNGTSWSPTSDSGGNFDWGYDVAARWVGTSNAAMYCRRTGMPGYGNQHLQCTAFDGTSWSPTSDSGGNIDWGYDLAAQWIGTSNGVMYCRRTGMPGYANQHLQCTTFNGTSWNTYDSGGEVDWGYNT